MSEPILASAHYWGFGHSYLSRVERRTLLFNLSVGSEWMSIPTMIPLSQFFSLTPCPFSCGVDVVRSKSRSPYGKGGPVQSSGGSLPWQHPGVALMCFWFSSSILSNHNLSSHLTTEGVGVLKTSRLLGKFPNVCTCVVGWWAHCTVWCFWHLHLVRVKTA